MHWFLSRKRAFSIVVCALAALVALMAASCKRAGETQANPAKQPATQQAAGQPPAQQAPAEPKVMMRALVDNERARVLEVVWEPQASLPAVKQEGTETLGIVGVVLKGGTQEYTSAKGEKTRHERKPGEVLWQPANVMLEARANAGNARMNIVQVRLKKAPPTKEYAGPLPGVKPVLDNPRCAAFDYALAPGATLPMHKYAPRVWVVLEAGDMRSTDKAGKTQFGRFAPGQVVWLAGKDEALENMGKTPVRIISIELK